MDIPCRHFWVDSSDPDIERCLLCGWYPDERKNEKIRAEKSHRHHNWHTYSQDRDGRPRIRGPVWKQT